MKVAIVLLLLVNSAFGRECFSLSPVSDNSLRVEIHSSSNHVSSNTDVVFTVLFRSPEKNTTIWNALGWGPSAGLFLQVLDSSGHQVKNDYAQMFHPLPPDLSGKGALISIGGQKFAGFDTRVSAKLLFPKPGRYIVKCFYKAPLPRDYFQGSTIWGREDGDIESPGISILVDK